MPNFDPIVTVVSQYANSPTLMQMIDSFRQQIQADENFQLFYDYIWNIDTAEGFGLDILGRIINLPRQITIPAIYPNNVPAGAFSMNDDQYRGALFLKAFANISDSASPSINNALKMLSGNRGNGFVRKVGTMAIQYTFYFAPEPYEYALVLGDSAVMRPAGVEADIMFTINPYFGFSEADSWQPFDQGVFASY